MVHIDIQGWEGEVCRSCIDALSERVKWVVIGVHSRIQDAELLQIFHGAGWILEHEKPTRFRYRPSQVNFEAMVTADGTQVWRNPRLAADPGTIRSVSPRAHHQRKRCDVTKASLTRRPSDLPLFEDTSRHMKSQTACQREARATWLIQLLGY